MPETILVVEDEPALQETLVYSLKNTGYVVEAVGDGRAAVERARSLKAGAMRADEALQIMTMGSAYALFRDDEIGSLEPGKLADMLILSDNLLQVPVESIKDVRVLMTMIGGNVEYCHENRSRFCPR